VAKGVLKHALEEALEQYANISDPNRRAYAAMMTVMDEQIGQVVEGAACAITR
jgi:arylsulfatase A-like enzyme